MSEVKLARVFPRKTKATPEDNYAFVGSPPLFLPEIDKVHISVTFTYDIPEAEKLAKAWETIAPIKIGGPAFDDPGEEFIPGRYLQPGYVITSRGCPNNCWFCSVPKREGNIRELPITGGHNVLDSNILACSDKHIRAVFAMLKRQKKKAEFTGGLEAKILQDWHIDLLWELRPKRMFFAYDTPDDLEPLVVAGNKLRYANFTRSHMACYVLIGWPKDTFENAKRRLLQTWKAGFLPMAMLWKNKNGDEDPEWRRFQRAWALPVITKNIIKEIGMKGFYFDEMVGHADLGKWKKLKGADR